jgi:prepilin-type N-terminal cleavage/methylation domain-containing protein
VLRGVPSSAGFTLVEVIVALTIFMVGVLGLGGTGVSLIRNAVELETREIALQAIGDRLTTISVDPRYEALDSLYDGTENDVLGRFTRTTTVARTQTAITGGGTLDFITVSVAVTGGGLDEGLSRSITVAQP